MTTDDPFMIAVRMAVNPPSGANVDTHIKCVYANFADYFINYESFLSEVDSQMKRAARRSVPTGSREN